MQTASHPTSSTGRPLPYPWRTESSWWLKNKRYFAYMVRELTAVFAALWVILFLVQIPLMSAGPENLPVYLKWLRDWMLGGWWPLFSVVALFMVVYHAITWFVLMGTVMWIRVGKRPIPAPLIVTAMFLAWLGISIVIGFFIATPIVGS
jgi:succinate dehydrogenase subunit C